MAIVRPRHWALLLAALVPTLPLLGQTPECLERTVTVSVMGSDGRPVHGLLAKDFRPSLRGNTVVAAHITEDMSAHRVVLLLDVSESVTGPPGEWNSVVTLAASLVQRLPSQMPLAIMTFAERTELLSDFTSNRDEKLRKLEALRTMDWHKSRTGTGTALLDALSLGLSVLRPARPGDTL